MALATMSNKKTENIYSDTFSIYAKNFGQLFLVFVIFIIVLAIPLFIFLPAYVAKINESVQAFDALAMYMVAYMLTSLIAPIAKMIVMMCAIGVFVSPFAMGMAGKIIADGMEGKKRSFSESFKWTSQNYKRLLSAYAVYYALIGVFAYAAFIGMTGLMESSHVIVEVWLYPVIVMLVGGGIALLLGTVFVPFCVIDQNKSGVHALGASFKAMYSRRFVKNFLSILAGFGITVGIALLAQMPYFCPFLIKSQNSSRFNNFIAFVNNLTSDVGYIIFAIVVYALVGIFLYIFSYHVFRSAKLGRTGRGGSL